MKANGPILLALLLICMPHTHAYKELFNILDDHIALTAEENAALRPFFHELQKQYDFLHSAALQNDDGGSSKLFSTETTLAIDPEYQAAFANLAAEFASGTCLRRGACLQKLSLGALYAHGTLRDWRHGRIQFIREFHLIGHNHFEWFWKLKLLLIADMA